MTSEAKDEVPPGHARNPSRWSKRVPLLLLALLGVVVAARLGAHQLGIAGPPWEPFFGDGSERVLSSSISRALPMPDAVLGACAYLVEAVAVVLGGRARWRDAPWTVVAYGGIAVLMALTSAALVVLQPTVDHAWCTLCLVSAAISFVVVAPAIVELRAAIAEVARDRRAGGTTWRALVRGRHAAAS